MNMPFGFSAPPTGRKHTKNLTRMIQNGMRSNGIAGIEGGMMGFMGLPWLTRGYAGKGSIGPWQWMTPWGAGMGGKGGGGGGGGEDPGTGGEDPGTGGDGSGNGGGIGSTSWIPPQLLYPPPIGTGAQWRNTMKYGA